MALFFGISMLHLSGAVNVILFLIIRPGLLLFAPPEMTDEPEIELDRPSTGLAPALQRSSTRLNTNNLHPQLSRMTSVDGLGERSWNLSSESLVAP